MLAAWSHIVLNNGNLAGLEWPDQISLHS